MPAKPILWAVALTLCAATWLPAQDSKLLARVEALEKQVAEQNARLQRLEETENIEKLTRAYGYYVNKNLWNQLVDLFSDDYSVEIAARGVYLGKKAQTGCFGEYSGANRSVCRRDTCSIIFRSKG
ncbi:MAG: nuclear transport factor 2 family protein [Acidobacteriia bacterium]|nr:nuclear transport factor 2 family protein [Terriglobia bacterium]